MDNTQPDPWFESMVEQIPVFVYGTLMKGNTTRGLNMFPGSQFVGAAKTKASSFSLYDLGSFPAVGISGNNQIQGEVWKVSQDTFETLDQIEGYPNFYNRRQVDTTHGKAWMYYIPNVNEYEGVEQIKGPGTVKWADS